LAVVQVVKVIA